MSDPTSSFRFQDVPTKPDFPAQEAEILAFWKEQEIYRKSLEARSDAERFVFYEGPPTANGMPHPGHCLTRAIKDLFPRYQTMRGRLCERKAGWDTHGLPVEVEVQKELDIRTKEAIEEYGIEPFIRKCQESVFRYTREWESLTERLGFWVDLESAYATYHQYYVESVWWSLKRLFDAGLLYQGNKIVWWWAQGGTGLSAGEVGEGYRTVDDPSVYVRMPLVDEENTALLVWTTTPWTLPSNQFCAVHEDLDYVVVSDQENGERLILAADLVSTVADKSGREFVEVERLKGSELVGRRYLPPFDIYHRQFGESREPLVAGGEESCCWRVVTADFVTTDSGTGVVHQAPAFGEVDYDVLLSERARFVDPDVIPLLNAVAPNGTFTSDLPEFEGQWVKDADKELIRTLKGQGVLFHREQYRHEYPFCPRSDQDALIQYPRASWFIKTTQFVDEMLANNQEITWLPEHIQSGRFGKYLESNVDWTLSRERYWGTPLPIWVCEETGEMEAIESYAELTSKPGASGTEVWTEAKKENPQLDEHLKVHRPWIDEVTYDSPFSPGARMRRVKDVIDCWFDAGCMPFAQWGFPQQEESRTRFADQFPASFISEALDQTRGWFYALLSISTMLFGEHGVARADERVPDSLPTQWPQPFRSCVVLGLLLGEDGLKMSKSKKNYRTPDYIFDREGSDAMRWLFFSSQSPWTSVRFQEQAIAEGQREFLIRLWNVYSFFTIYSNIDGWQPKGDLRGTPSEIEDWPELDRWILSELNRTVAEVRMRMDRLENFPAARALNDFVDALSNWYVRRSRDRFWGEGMTADKDAAYSTLYHCLVSISLLAAPFVPFLTEAIYRNLVGSRRDGEFPASIHLCDYPEVVSAFVDDPLSERMIAVREITSMGRAVRAQAKLKVRQPLDRVELVLARKELAAEVATCTALIEEELNVKKVHFLDHADEYVRYEVKPNFRSIGPKFGKAAPQIQKELKAYASPGALLRTLEDEGQVSLVLPDGSEVTLTSDDVQIEVHARQGWTAAQGSCGVLILHTEVTDELHREGVANEVKHYVQTSRKELDLEYTQKVVVHLTGEDPVLEAVAAHRDEIAAETLATSIATTPGPGEGKSITVEKMSATLWVLPQ